MANLTVTFELKDDDNNLIQSGMQVFDNNELTAGNVGAIVEIKYDKNEQTIDFVGTRPRDRK